MSHQIGSRTPRRDTYVGFCLYHEDQEDQDQEEDQDHYRHSCKGHIGQIVHWATTSQKLLAHHEAAGTSELSDVAARSQGMNRCSGHASSVDRIHGRVGASVRRLCSV